MELPARSGQLITVRVENDHLESLANPSGNLMGVAELIWNALDAEADHVQVRLEVNAIEGIDAVEIVDDGHGMTHAAALTEFAHLGGSWKHLATHSKNQKRLLHGSQGQGRWRAFSVGDLVRWVTVGKTDSGNEKTIITGRSARLTEFEVSASEPTEDPVGTTVRIENVESKAATSLLADSAADKLTTRLAPYLEKYPHVEIRLRNRRLDPKLLQKLREEYDLDLPDIIEGPASLLVIEWRKAFPREFFLCDDNGMALHSCAPGIRAPNFDFTAYLRWDGFRRYESELAAAEMNPELTPVIDAGKAQLRQHFKVRGEQVQAEILAQWKEEEVYPYEGEVSSGVERVERDLFDMVAVTAAKAVMESDRLGRKFSLRLLRQAVEQGPTALKRALNEVLELPADKLAELNDLLDRSPLTSIIAFGKIVTDRLDALAGLTTILFDPEAKKAVLERSQLHKILEKEAWIFGDEYALSVSDQGLSVVLQQHIGMLGREKTAEDADPVTLEDGSKGIVDLLFSRSIQLPIQQQEHLVVELKRPKVILGHEELTQISRYALAVANDPRFDNLNVTWNFWLLGVEMDDYVRGQAKQSHLPPGVVSQPLDGRVTVWVKTWSQVLDDCRQRLKFVSERLEIQSTTDSGVDFLRRAHAERLPVSVLQGVSASESSRNSVPGHSDRS